jgi:hypothetical protein
LLTAFIGSTQQASSFFLIRLFCDTVIGATLSKPTTDGGDGGGGGTFFFLFSSLFYFHKLEKSCHLCCWLLGRLLGKKLKLKLNNFFKKRLLDHSIDQANWCLSFNLPLDLGVFQCWPVISFFQ